jgi:L-threonylcarbamoyladenylate synthase
VSGPAAAAFEACIRAGGVAVFPADTVYGLACDPESAEAVARLYALKGRPADKPAAVMWFDRDAALDALPQLGPRTRAAVERLTPGGVTLLLPNPDGLFPLAAGPAGEGAGPDVPPPVLGVRVPALAGAAAALAGTRLAVLQSSANAAGGPDARTLGEVPAAMRARADFVLDAGELPGTPSTVIDLRTYEADGEHAIVRAGAVPAEDVARTLGIVGRP